MIHIRLHVFNDEVIYTLNLWDQRRHVGAKLNEWRAARQIDSHCIGSHVDLTVATVVATRWIHHMIIGQIEGP